MRKLILIAAASATLFSAVAANAQGGGGGGGGGGGSGGGGAGDASPDGVSPNGSADGPAGPYGTQRQGGRSVSNGGANSLDISNTQPSGAQNQQR